MANDKKVSVDNGGMQLDHELDFTLDAGSNAGSGKGKKDRKPITDVLAGAGKGAKQKAKTGAFWNEVAKKSLPRNYEYTVKEVEKTSKVLSDAYRDSVRSLKPDLVRIGRQIDALVPIEAKRIKRLTSKLQITAPGKTGVSTADLETQTIINAQAEIFGKMNESGNQREARDRAEQRVRDKLDSKRFGATANVLGNINEGIQRLTAYTTRVNASWQKKSLELQYRSYYVQSELLKSQNRYNEQFKAYFEAIKTNTSLPDMVKTKMSEVWKNQIKLKAFEKLNRGVLGVADHLSKKFGYYRGAVKGDLTDIGNIIQYMIMHKQDPGVDLGAAVTRIFGNKIGAKAAKYLKPDGKIMTGLHHAAHFASDPSGFFEKMKKSKQFLGLPKGLQDIASFIMGQAKIPERTRFLSSGGSSATLQPHAFTDRAHKSITEVIPGYLAMILQQQTAMRTGKFSSQQVYDWKSGRFMSSKKQAKETQARILRSGASQNVDHRLDEVAEQFTGKDNLRGKQSTRIKQFIHSAVSDADFRFTPEQVNKHPEFKNLPVRDQKVLLRQLSKLHSTAEGQSTVARVSSRLYSAHSGQMAEVEKHVDALINSGQKTKLLKEGVIKEDERGRVTLDRQKAQKFLNSKAVTSKGKKPKVIKSFIMDMNSNYGQKFQGWQVIFRGKLHNWDEDKKEYIRDNSEVDFPQFKPSDPALKASIKKHVGNKLRGALDKVRNLKTYDFKYRKDSGHDDGKTHRGYMADEVHKELGDKAAPGGKKVDMSYITSLHTAAIQELAKQKEKFQKFREKLGSMKPKFGGGSHAGDDSDLSMPHATQSHSDGSGGVMIDLLRSIDKRLTEMAALGHIQAGVAPDKEQGFFDKKHTVNSLMKGMLGAGFTGFRAATRATLRGGFKGAWGAGKMVTRGTFGAAGFLGKAFDRNKGRLGDAAHRVLDDLGGAAGMAYRMTVGGASLVPKFIRGTKAVGDKITETVGEILSKPKDLYLPGETEPILTAQGFRKGWYFDRKGKPITNLKELKKVKGSVFNKNQEELLNKTQMKQGLVDVKGKKLKHMVTGLGDAALGAVGHLTRGYFKAFGALGKMVGLGVKGGGLLGGAAGGMIGKFLGRFGLGGGKANKTLTEILTLLKKWDKKGMQGAGGSSTPAEVPSTSPAAPILAAAGATDAPEGEAKAGFNPLGTVGAGIRAAAGSIVGGKTRAFFSRAAGSRVAQRLGSIGGGRMGRVFGRLGGAITGAAGLLAGKQATEQPVDPNAPAEHHDEKAAVQPAKEAKPGFLASLMKKMRSKLPGGQRAWNDTEGTGRRTGDWQTRLDEMKEKDVDRHKGVLATAPEGHAGNAMSILSGAFDMLSGGISNLFGAASAMVGGGLFKGKLGKAGGMMMKVLGKGKWWGKAAAAAGVAGAAAVGSAAASGAGHAVVEGAEVAAKGAEGVVAKSAGKGLFSKLLAKGAAKGLAKQIPGLGWLLSAGLAGKRAYDGDYIGAGLELASAVPGLGLAANATLMYRDIKGLSDVKKPPTAAAGAKGATGQPPPNVEQASRIIGTNAANNVKTNSAPSTVGGDSEPDKLGRGSSPAAAKVEAKLGGGSSGGTPPLADGPLADGAAGLDFIKMGNGVNLKNLNPSVYKNFLAMAQEYGQLTNKKIQVNSAYRSTKEQLAAYTKDPSKAAKPGGSTHEFGLALDINHTDLDALEKAGLMRKYGFTRPVGGEPWHMEPAGIQSNIASAKADMSLAAQMTDAGLLKGGGGAGTVAGFRQGGRDQTLQMALLNDSGGSKPKTTNDNITAKLDTAAASGNVTTASAVPRDPAMKNSGTAPPSASPKAAVTAMGENNKYSLTQNKQVQMSNSDTPAPDAESKSIDKSTSGSDSGSDTADSNYPMDKDGILKTIAKSAQQAGVPGPHLQVVAAIESSLNPMARAGSSSAQGLFQFENATWKESMNKYGSKYNLKGDEPRSNVRASSLMAAEYMKSNLSVIKKANPNAGLTEAYLAHFLGASGAKAFMSSNPKAQAAFLFPGPAKSNPGIFFDGQRPRTVSEIYSLLAGRLQKAARDFGISGVSISTNMPGSKDSGSSDAGMSTAVAPSTQSTSGAVASTAPTSVTGGDYQAGTKAQSPIASAPKVIAAPTPSFGSNRTMDRRMESGDSPMSGMMSIAQGSMKIHQKQLDVMVEIKELVKTLVDAQTSAKPAEPAKAAPAPQQQPREKMQSPVNIERRRSTLSV